MAAISTRSQSAHRQALRTSAMLTRRHRRLYEPNAMNIEPEQVFKVLNKAKVRFVLMGAHGIGGYLPDARATQDVDLLVQMSHRDKAVQAVQRAFPELIAESLAVVTRFKDPATGKAVIDLMKPEEDLHRELLKHYTVPVGKTHCIPTLEMALACKFAAMMSPFRERLKKMQDLVDFGQIAKHNGDRIKLNVLFSCGEMVLNGGGAIIQRLVDDARSDRPLNLPGDV